MARLVSLDVVRGITVAGMILVNNGYGPTFTPLKHAEWNGLSLSDLVFPFFLFIMGVSLYLSFSGRGFDFTPQKFGKILKRTIILLLLGIAINWLDKALDGSPWAFGELRFWAVLQRIAVCYIIASVIALTVKHRYVLPITIGLLIIYAVIIILGHGYAPSKEFNIIYKVDEWMIGDAHMYHKSPVDPEGLLSTISALTNVLFGFYCGMKIKETKSLSNKITSLLIVGSLLTLAGLIISYALPFNKRIWSPTFALVTSGFCALLLALVMAAIDKDKIRNPLITFFHAFGVNALMLYISSELMAIFFGHFGISDIIYEGLSLLIPYAKVTSLLYAICFVMMNYAIAYPLYRKRIYIKL